MCSSDLLNGEDKDMEARYTTTSVGGKRAVQELALKISEQVEKDQTKPVPVIRLKKDHYTHKSYGKIFTPVFEIVEWVSMNGERKRLRKQKKPPQRKTRRVVVVVRCNNQRAGPQGFAFFHGDRYEPQNRAG